MTLSSGDHLGPVDSLSQVYVDYYYYVLLAIDLEQCSILPDAQSKSIFFAGDLYNVQLGSREILELPQFVCDSSPPVGIEFPEKYLVSSMK